MRAINGSLSFYFSQPSSLFTAVLLLATPIFIDVWWCYWLFAAALTGWQYQLIQSLAQGRHQLPSLSNPYWVLSGVLITALSLLLLPLSFTPGLLFGDLSVSQLIYDFKVLAVVDDALTQQGATTYYWETYKWTLFVMFISIHCLWLLITLNECAVYENEKYKPIYWLEIMQRYSGLLLKLIITLVGVGIVYALMSTVLAFITGNKWLFLHNLLFFIWGVTNTYLLGMFACTVRLQDSVRRAHRAAFKEGKA